MANFSANRPTATSPSLSASCIQRRVFDTVGLFPEGMKIAEDLYMWIRSPAATKSASRPNGWSATRGWLRTARRQATRPRRPSIRSRSCTTRWPPEEDREFVARAALGKALIISAKGGTKEAARAARFFAWTRTYRRTLRKVRALNALPAGWRGPVIRLYNALAWRLARKGL